MQNRLLSVNSTNYLNNTRVVYKDNGTGIPAIMQTKNYYPFGKEFDDINPYPPSSLIRKSH